MLRNKYIIYNHLADKKELNQKWNNKIKLTLVNLNILPAYIKNNVKKYKKLIAKKFN